MKSLRIILGLIFAALIILLVVMMCQPKKAQIQVVDADTEKPIEDASVDIESTDKYLGDISLTTDEDGLCTFKYRDKEATLQATASAEGYEKATVEDYDLSQFEDDILIIPLKKLKKVQIKVMEEGTGTPLPDATVKVKGSPYPGDVTLTTDEDGMCSFLCAEGQDDLESLFAFKQCYSCFIYNTSYLDQEDDIVVIPLQRLQPCGTEVDYRGKSNHDWQEFYMGDYEESDGIEFHFDYTTDYAADHIRIYNGTAEDIAFNRAKLIFEFNDTTHTMHTAVLPIMGPNLFVVVDNPAANSTVSSIWKYRVNCPE